MTEQRDRKTTRRDPINIVVELDTGEHQFSARPLPWRVRNDMGEMVNSLYAHALDLEIKALRDDSGGIVGVAGNLFEKVMDYPSLFTFAYSTYKVQDDGTYTTQKPPAKQDIAAFNQLDFDQMVEILIASLEVNGLDRLVHMLDPDRKKDPLTGASEPQIETSDAGAKTELLTASG